MSYLPKFARKLPNWFDFNLRTSPDIVTQDTLFPAALETATKVIVVVVPEEPVVGGGVLSLFSFARELRKQTPQHGFEVLIATRPQNKLFGKTYFKHKGISKQESVFRFSQVLRCKKLQELLLLIPEYAAARFVENLSSGEIIFLQNIPTLRINILNQNIELMPSAQNLVSLRALTKCLTQSVAHEAHGTQSVANKYGIPTLLLPACSDISGSQSASFAEKEKLIIYSPDRIPQKGACLAEIKSNFPDYELREINRMSFEEFLNIARRCLFSVSFGEGYDGYFCHPLKLGSVAFSVFDERFFPPLTMNNRFNLFSSFEEMKRDLAGRMKKLSIDEKAYTNLNLAWQSDIASVYDYGSFRRRVTKLVSGEFDFYPVAVIKNGSARK